MEKVNLLLADDHQLLRKALVSLLSLFPINLNIVEATNGREALEVIKSTPIDLVLLDMQMPRMNGLDCLKEIRENFPKVKVIMLTQFDNPSLIVSLVRAGANSFLLKDCSDKELEETIVEVLAKGTYFSESVKAMLLKADEEDAQMIRLNFSPREIEVAGYLKEGNSTKQIALKMNLAVSTIESYRKSLLAKANCKNVSELLKVFYETGLISK